MPDIDERRTGWAAGDLGAGGGVAQHIMSEPATQNIEWYITVIGAVVLSAYVSEYVGISWNSPWIIAVLCLGAAITYTLYRLLSWAILYIISGGKLY